MALLAFTLGCKAKKPAAAPFEPPTSAPMERDDASNQSKSFQQVALTADPFRVGLFFPVTRDLQGKMQLSDAALDAMAGLMIAFDSLFRAGFRADVQVTVGSNKDLERLIAEEQLVLAFNKGNFEVYDSTYNYNTNPSMPDHMRRLAKFWEQSKGPVYVVHQGSELERAIAEAFLKEDMPTAQILQTDSLDLDFWREKLMDSVVNRIYLCSPNERYVNNIMRILHELNQEFDIQVAGLPNWDRFATLPAEYLEASKTILTQSEYRLEGSRLANYVRSQYLSHFAGEATPAVYKAFDHGMYFGRMLLQQIDPFKNYSFSTTDFEFVQSEENWLQNQAVRLIQFENYTFNLLP
ncbi:MAG: hypothetical protein Q8J69_12085 [Sphingobacteriaceae bacterium]|nr:hypothetical protein [Sphingobacteriaceae bacterium]